jgi:hypothetical protein
VGQCRTRHASGVACASPKTVKAKKKYADREEKRRDEARRGEARGGEERRGEERIDR